MPPEILAAIEALAPCESCVLFWGKNKQDAERMTRTCVDCDLYLCDDCADKHLPLKQCHDGNDVENDPVMSRTYVFCVLMLYLCVRALACVLMGSCYILCTYVFVF